MNILLDIIDNVLNNKNKTYKITPDIYELAASNHMTQFLFLSMSDDTDDRIKNVLQNEYYTEVMRDATQNAGLEEIKDLFKENNIPFMRVKGFELKELYPSSEIRYMCDLDILVKREYHKKAVDLLKSIGYEFEDKSDHDIELSRKPFMTVELHHQLIYQAEFGKKYIDNVLKNETEFYEGSSEFHFKRIEDQYIYIFLHMLKHYERGGIGIRNFVDLYLLLNKNKDTYDFEYIHHAYKETKYYDDCMYLESYAMNLFDESYNEQTEKVLSMGTYGQEDLLRKNEIEAAGSYNKWLFRKIFPKVETMKGIYYCLNKGIGILLLPFCYMHRVIKYGIIDYSKNKQKAKTAKQINKKNN